MQLKRQVYCCLDHNLHRNEVCRILCEVVLHVYHSEEGKNVVVSSEEGIGDGAAKRKLGNEEEQEEAGQLDEWPNSMEVKSKMKSKDILRLQSS